jgi:hypothetical protein
MAELKSFEQARRRAGVFNRRPLRVGPIEVRHIVGSVDESKRRTLKASFLPRAWHADKSRYRSVLAAMAQDRPLPAIEVYSLCGEHYVLDGHHRVAAARSLGHLYIDALIHEFLLPVVNDGSRPAVASGVRMNCGCRASAEPARPPRRLGRAADALATLRQATLYRRPQARAGES